MLLVADVEDDCLVSLRAVFFEEESAFESAPPLPSTLCIALLTLLLFCTVPLPEDEAGSVMLSLWK